MLIGGFSAFAVGFVSNMYGRFFNGNAFVVMVRSPRIEARQLAYELSENRSPVFFSKCLLDLGTGVS